ncbi:MAG: zinc-ribbon domain containing protein [Dehalococcoidia bacterium]
MAYQDKTLTCQDCGQSFTHSAEDQQFFAQKGYLNEPKRCPTCRQSRRDQRGGSMGGYFQRTMYPIVCAECGKEAEVPFQPRGDRPVYCSDCYERQSGRARRF